MADSCVVESNIEEFVAKIEDCSRFEIAGLNEDETKFILHDVTKDEGIYGKYVEVDVAEVIETPADQVMAVLTEERTPIVCEGVSRIVGYYSRVHNWHKGKVGELRDRIEGRRQGAYGFETKGDTEKINDAINVTHGLSVLNA